MLVATSLIGRSGARCEARQWESVKSWADTHVDVQRLWTADVSNENGNARA